MTLTPTDIQAHQDWLDGAMAAFDNVVYRPADDGIWWSRNPQTTQWENDRAPGRRKLIVRQMVEAARARYDDLPPGDRRMVRRLSTEPGLYSFLRELDARFSQRNFHLGAAAEPHDFRTNRAH